MPASATKSNPAVGAEYPCPTARDKSWEEAGRPRSQAASTREHTGDIGTGLLDVFGAQIHLAVRHHRPKLPGNAQLSTFNGGCPPNACATVQVAQFLN